VCTSGSGIERDCLTSFLRISNSITEVHEVDDWDNMPFGHANMNDDDANVHSNDSDVKEDR
jgi:hypothetical protein